MGKVLDRPLFRKVVKLQRGGIAGSNLPVVYDPSTATPPPQPSRFRQALSKTGRGILGALGGVGVYTGLKDAYSAAQEEDYARALTNLGVAGLGGIGMLPIARPLVGSFRLGKKLLGGRLGKLTNFAERNPRKVFAGEVAAYLPQGIKDFTGDKPIEYGASGAVSETLVQESDDARFIQDQLNRLSKRNRAFKISGTQSNRQRQKDYLSSLDLQGPLSKDQKKQITDNVQRSIQADKEGTQPNLNEPINYLTLQPSAKQETQVASKETPKDQFAEDQDATKQKLKEELDELNIDPNNIKPNPNNKDNKIGGYSSLNQKEKDREQMEKQYGARRLDPSTIVSAMKKAKEAELASLKSIPTLRSQLPPREQITFDEFYKQNMAGTETDDVTRRLLFMKLGAGLMTGKTTNTGFSGFTDVFGQSLEPVLNDVQEIRDREIRNRRSLANQFYALQEEKKELARQDELAFIQDENQKERDRIATVLKYDLGIAEQKAEYDKLNAELDFKYYEARQKALERKTNRSFNIKSEFIVDPTHPLGGYHIKIYEDTKSRKGYRAEDELDKDGNFTGEINYVLLPETDRGEEPQPKDAKGRRLLESSLTNAALADTLIDSVLTADDDQLGMLAGLRLGVDNMIGTFNQFAQQIPGFSDNTFGSKIQNVVVDGKLIAEEAEIDQKILQNLDINSIEGATDKELEFLDEVKQQYRDEINKAVKNIERTDTYKNALAYRRKTDRKFRLSPEDRQALVKMEMTRVRLKFLLANAFKGEDRLTEQNLRNAEELVNVFAAADPETIREKFKQLKIQNDTKFKSDIVRLNRLDQSPSFYNKVQNLYGHMDFFNKEGEQPEIERLRGKSREERNRLLLEGLQRGKNR